MSVHLAWIFQRRILGPYECSEVLLVGKTGVAWKPSNAHYKIWVVGPSVLNAKGILGDGG